jgi:hypothetical protein
MALGINPGLYTGTALPPEISSGQKIRKAAAVAPKTK